MNDIQRDVVQRFYRMGYATSWGRNLTGGAVEIIMPCKLAARRMRLVVRTDGTYAPVGFWAHRSYKETMQPWQTS